MFVLRRIVRTNKNLTCFCTSSVLKCDKPKASNESKISEVRKKKKKKPKISSELNEDIKNFSAKPSKKQLSQQRSNSDLFTPALKSSALEVAKELGDKEVCSELLDYIKQFEVAEKGKHEVKFFDYGEESYEAYLKNSGAFQGYSNKDLNIFNEKILEETENQVTLKIWDELEAEELVSMTKLPPQNYFQELIQWTNEGKLWHFPIDNDQGMEEEASVSFTEHVFLEKHLEPWCPKKGPLRNFMLLVLIGLSKNPYLGVKEKKEHIEWFRNYFEMKKKLLQELGAMGPPKEIESQQDKT